MSVFKLMSVLLDYPGAELIDNLGEISRRLAGSDLLSPDDKSKLSNFIAYLDSVDLIDLQGEYVQTFDLNPDHSLHLTHHLCGDDRSRGPALIELSELYRQHGLELPENELPDYLPLVLEFLNELPGNEAAPFLAQAGRVLVRIASNLEKSASPWQAPVRVLADMSGAADDLDNDRPGIETCQSACGSQLV